MAQTANSSPGWNLNFSLGVALSGPSEDSFASMGLPGTAVGPFQKYIPWSVELNRALGKNFAAGITVEKMGYKGTFFDIQHNFKTIGISPGVSFIFWNRFSIGLGPAVYIIKQKPHYNQQSTTKYQALKAGFDIKSAITFIDHKNVSAKFIVKYCYTDKADHFEIADMEAAQQQQFIYYPEVKMSYFYTGIGLGFKIFNQKSQD